MLLNRKPKRGDKITYNREIMFKGVESVKAKVVAIYGRTILLDNGIFCTFRFENLYFSF